MDKASLRTQMRAKTRALPTEYKVGADKSIAAYLLSLPEYQCAKTVFCFVPTAQEPNVAPVLRDALAQGKRLCVPRCLEEAGQMALCVIRSLSELSPGAHGISEPPEDAEILMSEDVDFAVIPCVCCTRGGVRLGQGGGYYDRFLAHYDHAAAMTCREKLLCEDLPIEVHDKNVSLVVTEAGIFRNGVLDNIYKTNFIF